VNVTYTKRPDSRIRVQTVSYNANAGMRRTEVNGRVRSANAGGSTLVLTFFTLIRADLWVVGLDPEYRWALMGTPSRRRLWLIARTLRLDPIEYDRAMAIAAAQGYDAARVRPTPQDRAAWQSTGQGASPNPQVSARRLLRTDIVKARHVAKGRLMSLV
jgi:apolipoprotein D and lipocalin family protein